MDLCALGRRFHPAAGRADVPVPELAVGVRGVWGFGIIWAVIFYMWFRDNPQDHKSVNRAELALLSGNENLASGHGDVPWGKILRSRTIWLLWIQYFCITYPWYFFITWLPRFLQERYPLLTDTERANLSILPLFFGGIGALFCGFILRG